MWQDIRIGQQIIANLDNQIINIKSNENKEKSELNNNF